jgi:uncharacterized lipoprotein YddW (UPF0748 family)
MRLILPFYILVLGGIFFSSDVFAQHKKREMRGVWIATVSNIDFPTQKDDTDAQKKELIQMLDSLRSCNINTVIFQARPTADAFYESPFEPWSAYLTGKQGKAPSKFYDPLAFLIEEAHKRCMEVHVWMNPYRVTNSESTKELVREHIFFQKPQLFRKYGGRYLFDPGLDETRDHFIQVVADIVTRYDLDAIHLDDYFYPYKVAGEEFPDAETHREFSRGIEDRGDWRRDNVSLVVARLHDTIKSLKPWVEFGISPFGVWRNESDDPRGSATKATANYDELHADILKWLENCWIDYVAPQLYWEIGLSIADYAVLATWWSEYTYGKKLYIGLYASGMEVKKTTAWKTPNELVRQLHYNRDCEEIQGAMFYSARYFLKNVQGLKDSLRQTFYPYPALTPASKAPEGESFSPPQHVRIIGGALTSSLFWDKIEEKDGNQLAYYVVYAFSEGGIGDMNNPANILALTPENHLDLMHYPQIQNGIYTFVVTAVNRFRQESEPSIPVVKRNIQTGNVD